MCFQELSITKLLILYILEIDMNTRLSVFFSFFCLFTLVVAQQSTLTILSQDNYWIAQVNIEGVDCQLFLDEDRKNPSWIYANTVISHEICFQGECKKREPIKCQDSCLQLQQNVLNYKNIQGLNYLQIKYKNKQNQFKGKFINAYTVKTSIDLLSTNIKGSYSIFEKQFYLSHNFDEDSFFLNLKSLEHNQNSETFLNNQNSTLCLKIGNTKSNYTLSQSLIFDFLQTKKLLDMPENLFIWLLYKIQSEHSCSFVLDNNTVSCSSPNTFDQGEVFICFKNNPYCIVMKMSWLFTKQHSVNQHTVFSINYGKKNEFILYPKFAQYYSLGIKQKQIKSFKVYEKESIHFYVDPNYFDTGLEKQKKTSVRYNDDLKQNLFDQNDSKFILIIVIVIVGGILVLGIVFKGELLELIGIGWMNNDSSLQPSLEMPEQQNFKEVQGVQEAQQND